LRCWCPSRYRCICRIWRRTDVAEIDAKVREVLLLEDQPPLGVHRDSKKAPNKNIDPDIPGTHTGPLKRSSFVKMSNVATVENATPNPRQMIAKKYFTFIPST
jgi:hypothetical protein